MELWIDGVLLGRLWDLAVGILLSLYISLSRLHDFKAVETIVRVLRRTFALCVLADVSLFCVS